HERKEAKAGEVSDSQLEMPSVLTDGRMCGAVRYRILEAPIAAGLCHCNRCRPQSGSAFSTIIIVKRSTFAITGETAVFDDIGSIGLHVAPILPALWVTAHDGSRCDARTDVREGGRHRCQRMVSSGYGAVRGTAAAVGLP